MNILYAKDCHDCSVNKNPDISSPAKSKFETLAEGVETPEAEKLRVLLCAEAASGLGNWKRFQEIIEKNNIDIEDYYKNNKCGPFKSYTFMFYSVFKAGMFGKDFIEDFLIYLTKRQEETGDKTLIYRLLNFSYDPEHKRTLRDDFRVSGQRSDLKTITLINKYGAKEYNELTDDEKSKGYYLDASQVAKK
jgi:hypothetical protein